VDDGRQVDAALLDVVSLGGRCSFDLADAAPRASALPRSSPSLRVEGAPMPREHVIDATRIHHAWDRTLDPVLSIQSGDSVHYDIPMAGDGQVEFGATFEECRFDFDTIYNLSGPLVIEGAEPGDSLQVEIIRLTPGSWGWCAFLPELGLLADDFPAGYVRTFDLTGGETTTFAQGVEIPITPFFGTMGNAPAEPGVHLPFPPHEGGGNMDTRHLTQGTTLWLPVLCPGALFSVGDPHAAQGDGEVCVAALECPMQATLRFTLHKRSIDAPRFRTPGPLTRATDTAGYYGTMGIAPDLMDGARRAVRAMITWLADEHDLSREDAYILCSLIGDLKIFEVVDAGVWNVGVTMPLSIFHNGR
jgi:acetamidase/formamidase